MKNTPVLIKLVKEEARNLKKKATKTELSNLDFKELNPSTPHRCIYGQITGDCFEERAKNLIEKCATKIYQYKENMNGLYNSELNGKPNFEIQSRKGFSFLCTPDIIHYSPIECFITNPLNKRNGNNKTLINYLKGKTKTLRFKN